MMRLGAGPRRAAIYAQLSSTRSLDFVVINWKRYNQTLPLAGRHFVSLDRRYP